MSPSRPLSAEITRSDLIAIREAANGQPERDIPLAVDAVAQERLGHGFMTVMRLHEASMELERIYSSRPNEYPVGRRKQKRGLPWAEHVLIRGEVYVGAGEQDLRWAFDDHQRLLGLGLGSVINTPVRLGGRCLGTFNLLHGPGWYRAGDEQLTQLLAYLLIPAFFPLVAS